MRLQISIGVLLRIWLLLSVWRRISVVLIGFLVARYARGIYVLYASVILMRVVSLMFWVASGCLVLVALVLVVKDVLEDG